MRINSLSGALALALCVRVRNDGDTIEQLQQKLIDLTDAAKNVQNRADAEKRLCTKEEETEISNLLDEFEDVSANIERRERILAAQARLNTPAQRRGDETGEITDAATLAAQRQPEPRPRTAVRATQRIEALDDKGKNGFRSFGEFAKAVLHGSAKGAQPDPRLFANQAPTTYGSEGVGADGGFAVPPDFRQEIMIKVMGEDQLLSRTDQQTSSTNNFTFPKDETTPWQQTGGILAYWDGEAGQKTQSKPSLGSETVKLNKLICLVPMTDELLEDAPAMQNYLRKKAPEKINFLVNNAIINGTGSATPLGILNAASTIVVTPESGQAADSVTYGNIVDMWTRLYSPLKQNAVWLVNDDVEAQLMRMSFNGVSGGNVFPTPVYLPPGGLSGAPYSTLMGKPVLPQQACPALGNQGDIILTDLAQYLSLTKTGGIRSDVSIHLFFDYDVTAFRFVLRIGGQPWWSSAIAPFQSGSQTRSWAVTLGAR